MKKKIQAQIFRDGTSQGDRQQRSLDPDYIVVDEQTLTDWLEFAHNYGKNLTYFNELNESEGDWSVFFPDNSEITDIVQGFNAILADSDNNSDLSESIRKKLSQPHLALFLTFLKLLRYPQQQFKEITQRRLDFYYRQVLQLAEKAAQPDHVHVVFNLAPNQTEHLLPAETPLSAGIDAQGSELRYRTDTDLFITPAQVASIKTLSVKKDYIDLEAIHRQENRTNQGFENMLRWAVGRPNQGDALPNPAWNTNNSHIFAVILEMFWEIKDSALAQVSQDRQDYILNKLCFTTLDEFKFCLDAHTRENKLTPETQTEQEVIPPTEVEWQQVYSLVEKAYRKKINQDRRDRLKQEHQENPELDKNEAFFKLWRFALGDPLAGDPLPFFREQEQDNLDRLLQEVRSDKPEDANRYIQEQLFLSVADFQKIMGVQGNPAAEFESLEWDEVYRLLERAQTKKRNFIYPAIGRTEIKGIHGQAIADAEPQKPLPVTRFHPFVAQSDSSSKSVQSLGVAIASPVLHLQEGTREITVTIACDAETFDRSQLENFYKQEDSPFNIAISSEKGWLPIESEQFSFDIGDFFLESSLKSYEPDHLTLIYQAPSGTFSDSDQGKYLQFADGSLYHIDDVLNDGNQLQLSTIGSIEATGEILKYDSLELSDGIALSNPRIVTESNLSEIITDNDSFNLEDVDQFIVWTDGKIYQIKEFVNSKKVSVAYWGYLPASSAPAIKKHDRITLALRGTEIPTELSPTKVAFTNEVEGKFVQEDLNTLLVWVNGEVYKLTRLAGEREVLINAVGRIQRSPNPDTKVEQYSASGIYPNSLQFKVTLDETQPSIMPPPKQDSLVSFQTVDPMVKISFREGNSSFYKTFKDLCLEKVNVQVVVEDLKDLQLRNDRSVLNPKSPFEPFGFQPAIGNSFYFAHSEIVANPLDSLIVKLEWIGLPEDFGAHYAAYSQCGLLSPALDNSSFKTKLELFLSRTWHEIDERSLFSTDTENSKLLSSGNLQYDKASFDHIPDYSYTSPSLEPTTTDLLEQSRYFRLELISPGFQQDLYPLVLNKVARAGENDFVTNDNGENTTTKIQSLTVYPPYTPRLKSIAIAYEASAEIDLLDDKAAPQSGQVFQLNPFGYLDLGKTVDPNATQQHYYLLPQYEMDGDLYIGLRDLKPPQSLTLLFQMVSGSGNADLSNPNLEWSYLAGDRWQPFQTDEILSDSTNGLLDSGIIHFVIPEQANKNNHLLPRGLHWLKVTVNDNALAIPDGLDIRAQAVTATFLDQDNDPEHLSTPLPADSITSLIEHRPGIDSISQPYSSFAGKRQESDRLFSTRVSERLRHKQRALTRWDYEHLVLENFTQIYKVKCLTQAEQSHNPSAAQVTLVVIPNLANTAPFLPLEPKAPQYLLREIEAYLQARTSPFVKVVVKNPHYEQIKYRIAVRFRSTSDQGYYMQQLNEELVRFLSPWAYEEQSDISFGSSIHSSAVIHFVETRPYVDYLANLKLIEQVTLSNNPNSQRNNTYQVNTSNLAQVKQVDSILVSAPEHIIDLITTANYSPEQFEGIDYMAIGVDFVVT